MRSAQRTARSDGIPLSIPRAARDCHPGLLLRHGKAPPGRRTECVVACVGVSRRGGRPDRDDNAPTGDCPVVTCSCLSVCLSVCPTVRVLTPMQVTLRYGLTLLARVVYEVDILGFTERTRGEPLFHHLHFLITPSSSDQRGGNPGRTPAHTQPGYSSSTRSYLSKRLGDRPLRPLLSPSLPSTGRAPRMPLQYSGVANDHAGPAGSGASWYERAPGAELVRGRTWVATVRGTYPTPEAGTRTPYVQYVGPWGQAALRVRYVPNAGG
jgi:hypothetical protein